MDNLEILQAVAVISVLVVSVSLHEAAHAFAADRLGDPTARQLGRLTLNPVAHIDPIWSVVIPVFLFVTSGFAFGGARPVPVDPRQLRHPLRDMALVAIAGPLSNLLIAAVLMVAYKVCLFMLGYHPEALLPDVLGRSIALNVLLTVFNLVPIPPLDGSRVLMPLLPVGLRPAYANLERFGILIILGIFFVWPVGNGILQEGMSVLWNGLWALTGGIW